MSKIHLAYREENKGWVSFFTHYPEFMASLGNKFFTVKDGQLWEHNDLTNPNRGYFYNDFHEMKLNFQVNNQSNDEMIFKTVKIEGTDSWDLTIETNYTLSTLLKEDFNKKESNFYAYFRQNESASDLSGLKTVGIGNLNMFSNSRFYFNVIPDEVNVDDILFQSDGVNTVEVGAITEITLEFIKVNSFSQNYILDHNAFFFAVKDSRINGSEVRGYYADITIVNDSQFSVELHAVSTNVIKSYV